MPGSSFISLLLEMRIKQFVQSHTARNGIAEMQIGSLEFLSVFFSSIVSLQRTIIHSYNPHVSSISCCHSTVDADHSISCSYVCNFSLEFCLIPVPNGQQGQKK